MLKIACIMRIAKVELEKRRLWNSVNHKVFTPIHIDYVKCCSTSRPLWRVSIETAFGKDNVVIDVQKLSIDDGDNATYSNHQSKDFDGYHWLGTWLPRPIYYLDIFEPNRWFNLDWYGTRDPKKDQALIEKIGLTSTKALLMLPMLKKLDTNARYEKYADAQLGWQKTQLFFQSTLWGGLHLSRAVTPFSTANSAIGIRWNVSSNIKLR